MVKIPRIQLEFVLGRYRFELILYMNERIARGIYELDLPILYLLLRWRHRCSSDGVCHPFSLRHFSNSVGLATSYASWIALENDRKSTLHARDAVREN